MGRLQVLRTRKYLKFVCFLHPIRSYSLVQ